MPSINELGNQFSNVIDKLRNPKVDNEVAWDIAQPLLRHLIEGYPEEFIPYLGVIREVFNLRRDAFRNIDDRQKKSREASEVISKVLDESVDPIFVTIRDCFNISPPGRNTSRVIDG